MSNTYFVVVLDVMRKQKRVLTGLTYASATGVLEGFKDSPNMLLIGNAQAIQKHSPEVWKRFLSEGVLNE